MTRIPGSNRGRSGAALRSTGRNDEHYTPAALFEQLGVTFALDVAAPPGGVPWIPAARSFTRDVDGLAQEWAGNVWMNPPFSKPGPWVERFLAHRDGIALLPTSKVRWFEVLWASGAALVFPGVWLSNAFGIYMPVLLAAFGEVHVEAIARCGPVR